MLNRKAILALVRHGQSEWNAKGLWTGLVDVSLTEKGRQEARQAATLINELTFHIAFTSNLSRAHQTLEEMLTVLGLQLPITRHQALNERHYGIHTGKNKWEVKKQVGDEEFMKIRRSWDFPIEGGESLKDVHARVIPYYQAEVHQHIIAGKNVLLVAHGNTIRALVKHLEGVADDKIAQVEIATGEVLLYHLNRQGKILKKESRR
ncbi:MAG: 2,3-bisphosphoglycerate-dependent phosphoglycerate mutase [Candidatus Gottesmanbacteria bacterium GW2011_GWA1_48_13]|uniref:2,3-bisphosphoglycerate-dependent phosphoglycerate mutase n=2 Tax=Candidatus Gottesmaniibacteriota TaxID=1752720 RepID=A0A0G1UQI7_9BACT|nr:MAG: 2,3-bisphosphoglycerate-dependent phosphoglycerate mutase [Candidatus Gottesmanbacteria bacterium GW2011_GWA1_48_13]